MRLALKWTAAVCVLLAAGCTQQAKAPTTGGGASGSPKAVVDSSAPSGNDAEPGTADAADQDEPSNEAAAAANAAPIQSGVAVLSPENTKIEFVGTHVGAKPDPRTGGFETFNGKAEVDADGKTLKSVSVEIETGSLWTQFPKLTTHLNSPDFFDTREYPSARFESTRITPDGDDGNYKIAGKLTLLKATKEIEFPATVTLSDTGLTLKASFTIDRVEFGMDRLLDGVEKSVSLNVKIGEKTQPLK